MLRPATIDDAFDLAPRLRQADLEELEAQDIGYPDVILAESVAVSAECLAFVPNGTVEALFGVADAGEFGVPWLLGSDELFNQGRLLMTLPRPYLSRWLEKYKLLQNVVHTENIQSIRWLKRLGFTIASPVPLGRGTFHPFFMASTNV